jgi:hypothetical protein
LSRAPRGSRRRLGRLGLAPTALRGHQGAERERRESGPRRFDEAEAHLSRFTAFRNAAGAILALGLAGGVRPALAAPCDAQARARLLAPPTPDDDAAALTCSLRLAPGERIRRRLILEGAQASGVELDCNGASIGEPAPPPRLPYILVEIRSVPGEPARWQRPSDVTLRNCTILGQVRVWGMAVNGQGGALRLSSRSLGHTERAQAAAPTRVSILDSQLVAYGQIPLYLGPGVTAFTLRRSSVTGTSPSVGLYLDAESAGNVVEENTFDIATAREVVAVDGSARNAIRDNVLAYGYRGGIHLYRNCGEGGTIRHQTPSDNVITGNRFRASGLLRPDPVKVGSRGGWGWTMNCGADAGYPFGSSLDDGDGATGNVVEGNRVE